MHWGTRPDPDTSELPSNQRENPSRQASRVKRRLHSGQLSFLHVEHEVRGPAGFRTERAPCKKKRKSWHSVAPSEALVSAGSLASRLTGRGLLLVGRPRVRQMVLNRLRTAVVCHRHVSCVGSLSTSRSNVSIVCVTDESFCQ